jgi:hypothetical protein
MTFRLSSLQPSYSILSRSTDARIVLFVIKIRKAATFKSNEIPEVGRLAMSRCKLRRVNDGCSGAVQNLTLLICAC